ncbi:hypothetical protein KQX54_012409 [Cotesia glomerata]|uniref:MYND-type domain-containing protein n=1 Tax=Cotesia glomerata TaxID=32391 RepID=A0AAV7IHQ9_COTGL|nr:hypothetical protein KQX54_012409 [Cotesia glomerata]
MLRQPRSCRAIRRANFDHLPSTLDFEGAALIVANQAISELHDSWMPRLHPLATEPSCVVGKCSPGTAIDDQPLTSVEIGIEIPVKEVAAAAALPLPDIFDIEIEPFGPANQISDTKNPESYVHRPVTGPNDHFRSTQQCNVCASTKRLWCCPHCKNAYYCSNEHQSENWPVHRFICTPPDERVQIFRELAEQVCPTKTDEHDRRPFVDVQIRERTIKALLDTGASVTCIKEVDERNWVYGLGARVRPMNKKTAAVADGSVMAIHALVTLPLVINDEMRPVEVQVIPKLNYDMILGMDAIAAFEICYDRQTGRWWTKRTDDIYEWNSKTYLDGRDVAAIV